MQQQKPPSDLPEEVKILTSETMSWMQEQREHFVSELTALVAIASASNNLIGLNTMATILCEKLRRIGMTTTMFEHPSGNAVLGEISGEHPEAAPILLLGHHDTVYAEGVSAPPIALEGEIFYGPGTIDMKAGLLQAIYALEGLLCKQQYRAFNKILFLSVPDEEVIERNHLQLLERVCQAKPFVLVLEGAKSPGNVVVRRKGCAYCQLRAQGIASHAGTSPEKGRSAVLEIAHQIVQFCRLNQSMEGLSINAAPLVGGTLPNIVPDFAEVTFEIRFRRWQDYHTLVAQWQELMQHQLVKGVTLTLTAEEHPMPPMEMSDESRVMAEKARLITSWLKVPYDPEVRGGGSDGGWTSTWGCPTLDGFGAVGAAAHSPKEHIVLEPVAQKTAMLAGMIAYLTM
ncbi:MAG: M20 family metallopeptidase [Chloroflexi bacterium]|nr:MAG: M20 family metallopeptidase [Chloroflexota bacterium]